MLQENKKAYLKATHSIGGLGVPENERITTGTQMAQTTCATRQTSFVFKNRQVSNRTSSACLRKKLFVLQDIRPCQDISTTP
jgi:hypothetical protein